MEYQDALTRVIDDVVAPNAAEIDRTGDYPRANLDALGEAGILGLCSARPTSGGGGEGLAAAAEVVDGLARHCGSTAMVVIMHYSATAVARGARARGRPRRDRRRQPPHHARVLRGREPQPLLGAARHRHAARDDGIRLDARKSWVTSAGEADSYVWSSLPLDADGPMTLWLVAADAAGPERRRRLRRPRPARQRARAR